MNQDDKEPEEYESRIKKLWKNRLDPDPEWWPDTIKEVRK